MVAIALVFVSGANHDVWSVLEPLGITPIDPFLLSICAGFIWPHIQAIFDKPWWTPSRRFWLAVCAAVILSVVVWAAGHYPLTWKLLATQAGVIFATLTVAFRILKALGVIDWVGRVTPGGEPRIAVPYMPKHADE